MQSALLIKLAAIISLWASSVSSHDMTPAYPEIKNSHISGIVKVEMSLFNARKDVSYYQIQVFDKDWNTLPFSSMYRILKVPYQERKNFDVYLRKVDLKRIRYLCTTSKVNKSVDTNTLVSSRICSRLDGKHA